MRGYCFSKRKSSWATVMGVVLLATFFPMQAVSAEQDDPVTIEEWNQQHGFTTFAPPDVTEKDIPVEPPSNWVRPGVLLSSYLAKENRSSR